MISTPLIWGLQINFNNLYSRWGIVGRVHKFQSFFYHWIGKFKLNNETRLWIKHWERIRFG